MFVQDDPVAATQTHLSSGCGRFQPQYRRQGLEIWAEWKKNVNEDTQERKICVSASRALDILRNISDEDATALGEPLLVLALIIA